MEQYIKKSDIVAEIEKRIELFTSEKNQEGASQLDKLSLGGRVAGLQELKVFLDTLDVKDVDVELENENNNSQITIGTKIRLKANPNIILRIISNDCHGDEFECTNGCVLSLKQIEKYYDIMI